jgi:hypothetical protein
MGDAGENTRKILTDAAWNFLAAIGVLALAIGFSIVEKWCVSRDYPEYVCFGARVLAVGLFIIDGVVVLANALILGWKLTIAFAKKKHEKLY